MSEGDNSKVRRDTAKEHAQKTFYWDLEKLSPKRTFLIPCPHAEVNKWGLIDNLQGRNGGDLSAGRIDLVCRVISGALFFSGGVRRDSEICVVLGSEEEAAAASNPAAGAPAAEPAAKKGGGGTPKEDLVVRSVTVTGATAKHLRPDERNMSVLLQCAIWVEGGMLQKVRSRGAIKKGTLFDQLQEVVEQVEGGGDPEELREIEEKAGKKCESCGRRRDPNYKRKGEQEPGESHRGGQLGEGGKEASMRCLEGWEVTRRGFRESLEACVSAAGSQGGGVPGGLLPAVVLQLDEHGEFVSDVLARFECRRTPFVCVLGDHKGLTGGHLAVLGGMETVKVNLGPRPLLSSQAITIFQHYLDVSMDREGLRQSAPV